MRVRRTLVTVLALGAVAFGATGAASARSDATPAATTKTCRPGYLHANLSWGEKCLHAGQFCKVGNRQYLRYGYRCPASGHLVSTRRRK